MKKLMKEISARFENSEIPCTIEENVDDTGEPSDCVTILKDCGYNHIIPVCGKINDKKYSCRAVIADEIPAEKEIEAVLLVAELNEEENASYCLTQYENTGKFYIYTEYNAEEKADADTFVKSMVEISDYAKKAYAKILKNII